MKGMKLIAAQGKPEDVIVPLVNRVGQVAAAHALKVAPATINRWLEENGYVKVIRYERKEQS